MAVKVIIPTPLRVYAAKKDSAEVSAQTVGEALGGLTMQYADLRKHLFTEDGRLRSFVNVYLNDEDIRYMAKEATPVKDGDVVSAAVPAAATGGKENIHGPGGVVARTEAVRVNAPATSLSKRNLRL
jgi:adenylyltransferase/sulfurtransferase